MRKRHELNFYNSLLLTITTKMLRLSIPYSYSTENNYFKPNYSWTMPVCPIIKLSKIYYFGREKGEDELK